MKKLFTFFVLLLSFNLSAANYYWVGGSGNWTDINHWRTAPGGTSLPSVIPGPTDNVFFDAKSGFTATSKTITIDNTANCHNITFAGSSTAPTLTQNGNQTLNIYGSSEWQSGMATIAVTNIYYRHTGEAKTIKSNGVMIGGLTLYFEEENTISLLDDFQVERQLDHLAGTWNTNNHTVTIGAFLYATNGTKARTINLGNSKIILPNSVASFRTNNPQTTVNSGTSHIYFTNATGTNNGMHTNPNQTFYNVIFEGATGFLNGGATYNQVDFKGNGGINGDNIFKNLLFSATKTYTFESGKTQRIFSLFSANTPQCGGWSTIISSIPNSKANLIATTGVNINVSGVIMKDISGSGGADFSAINSVNNGNNTGWTFPPYTGQDLYWVGGSGNWNDKAHWSQSPGGLGGYCVPGPTDNTFFDAGSGFTSSNKTVSIDNISYTKNITFSGSTYAPTLTQSGNQTFNIYGSSEWQTGMGIIAVTNIYYRHTNEAKTIKSNGVITGGMMLYFEEESSISLLDDFQTDRQLEHQAGTWNTNNYKVTIGGFFYAITGSKPRTINLGSSTIILPNSVAAFRTNNPQTTVNAGTSHIFFTTSNSASNGLNTNPTQTFYNVTFGGPLGSVHGGANYNQVDFKGNGIINANNNFKNLLFTPTKTYTFEAGKTQTISTQFLASTPQCGGWSTIVSNTLGTQANIIATTGVTIDVSGVIMKDIKASGGTIFTANNSVDNGNNSGWTFPEYMGQNLYWVGGSGNWNDRAHWSKKSGDTGGYCVPGPADNTFFDEGSGFTSSSKTISVDNISYTHNITFSGSSISPILTQSGNQTLNIYGSSEWQSGMGTIAITNIYYRHTNEAKTIKSNGVITGGSMLYFEEENSISLLDDFQTDRQLEQQAGIWNTNNHKVTIGGFFYAINGSKQRTLNLGSSDIILSNPSGLFRTDNPQTTINAGTSHIQFINGSSNNGIYTSSTQTFYNLTFYKADGIIRGGSKYNKVEFKFGGLINGNNTFKDLILSAGKTYTLQNATTQTIENWTLGGTPCEVTFVQSSSAGTRANVNVTGTVINFNFGNLKDINASGQSLHFGEQSTIANQNNNNITYDPYNPGAFEGLGADWIDHKIDNSDPSTYIVSASKFYGNNYTSYKWYKIDGLNSSSTKVISTEKEIDIRKFGYGTYEVKVDYSNGNTITCSVNDNILLKGILKKVLVNPSIRIRVQ
ncbi:hypothetical protein [Empedobacter sedimenti]|uniref:hypothetical protein n=1 Tax=Empedobacter sedimenti TaxID=3042610 RepID=UPI0024A64A88|nr:hypothetical protein [Empedobacter sedimenti]